MASGGRPKLEDIEDRTKLPLTPSDTFWLSDYNLPKRGKAMSDQNALVEEFANYVEDALLSTQDPDYRANKVRKRFDELFDTSIKFLEDLTKAARKKGMVFIASMRVLDVSSDYEVIGEISIQTVDETSQHTQYHRIKFKFVNETLRLPTSREVETEVHSSRASEFPSTLLKWCERAVALRGGGDGNPWDNR